jgi:hypothetical protein
MGVGRTDAGEDGGIAEAGKGVTEGFRGRCGAGAEAEAVDSVRSRSRSHSA